MSMQPITKSGEALGTGTLVLRRSRGVDGLHGAKPVSQLRELLSRLLPLVPVSPAGQSERMAEAKPRSHPENTALQGYFGFFFFPRFAHTFKNLGVYPTEQEAVPAAFSAAPFGEVRSLVEYKDMK